MNKPLTPEQRAAYRDYYTSMVTTLASPSTEDFLALLDAADERDRLAADLETLRQRAEQGAALPQPVSDAVALHVVALYAILATPGATPFRVMAANVLRLSPVEMVTRAHAVAGDVLKILDVPGATDEAADRKAMADIGRRVLAGEG